MCRNLTDILPSVRASPFVDAEVVRTRRGCRSKFGYQADAGIEIAPSGNPPGSDQIDAAFRAMKKEEAGAVR